MAWWFLVWLPRHAYYMGVAMDYAGLVISMLAVIGGGAVALVLIALLSYARDALDRTRYMSKRERKRIDDLEKRVADIERDIYFNGKA